MDKGRFSRLLLGLCVLLLGLNHEVICAVAAPWTCVSSSISGVVLISPSSTSDNHRALGCTVDPGTSLRITSTALPTGALPQAVTVSIQESLFQSATSLTLEGTAIAATRVPLHVTILQNTFATNAVLHIHGAFPPDSNLTIAGNRFTVNGYNNHLSPLENRFFVCVYVGSTSDTIFNARSLVALVNNSLTSTAASVGWASPMVISRVFLKEAAQFLVRQNIFSAAATAGNIHGLFVVYMSNDHYNGGGGNALGLANFTIDEGGSWNISENRFLASHSTPNIVSYIFSFGGLMLRPGAEMAVTANVVAISGASPGTFFNAPLVTLDGPDTVLRLSMNHITYTSAGTSLTFFWCRVLLNLSGPGTTVAIEANTVLTTVPTLRFSAAAITIDSTATLSICQNNVAFSSIATAPTHPFFEVPTSLQMANHSLMRLAWNRVSAAVSSPAQALLSVAAFSPLPGSSPPVTILVCDNLHFGRWYRSRWSWSIVALPAGAPLHPCDVTASPSATRTDEATAPTGTSQTTVSTAATASNTAANTITHLVPRTESSRGTDSPSTSVSASVTASNGSAATDTLVPTPTRVHSDGSLTRSVPLLSATQTPLAPTTAAPTTAAPTTAAPTTAAAGPNCPLGDVVVLGRVVVNSGTGTVSARWDLPAPALAPSSGGPVPVAAWGDDLSATCTAVTASTLECLLSRTPTAADRAQSTTGWAVPPPLLSLHCRHSTIQLILPVTDEGVGDATVRVLFAVAAGATSLPFFGEPLSVEGPLLTMLFAGPCASPSDHSAARFAVYMLSPVASANPGTVVLAHALLATALLTLHALFAARTLVSAPRRHARPYSLDAAEPNDAMLVEPGSTAAPLPPKDAWWGACAQWRFPSLSFAAAAALYPGAAWGTAAAVRAGAWWTLPVGALFLVALPAFAALFLLRLWPLGATIYVSTPVAVRAASLRSWLLLPTGRFVDNHGQQRAVGWLRGFGNQRGTLALVPNACLCVAGAWLWVAAPRSSSCAPRAWALSVLILFHALGVAVLRPYRHPLTIAATAIAQLLLAATAAVFALAASDSSMAESATSSPVKLPMAFVLMALMLVRRVHVAAVWIFSISTERAQIEASAGDNVG